MTECVEIILTSWTSGLENLRWKDGSSNVGTIDRDIVGGSVCVDTHSVAVGLFPVPPAGTVICLATNEIVEVGATPTSKIMTVKVRTIIVSVLGVQTNGANLVGVAETQEFILLC